MDGTGGAAPRRRTGLGVAVAAVALLALAAGCGTGADDPAAATTPPAAPTTVAPAAEPTPTPSPAPQPEPPPTVTISAVGDVVMGAAPRLPPDGQTLFAEIVDLLTGEIVLANLDQAITDGAASSKCAPDASSCYAFRTPTASAQWLADAGFTIVNLANNHTRDFGTAGLEDTRAALEAAGVQYTGLLDQIAYTEVDGVRVATVGFSPYGWTQSLLDFPAAVALVEQADAQADLVVATIHAGAEGFDYQHVRPGTEIFLGENRGDPMAFSRAVIDAGADVVIGAGPHVLRGMEFYEGRLIAYSLGNFTGYRALSNSGPKGVGGVLTVELAADGTWRGGTLVPTVMVDPGIPRPDPSGQAINQVQRLSADDFGACAVALADDGTLGAPTC